MIEQFYDISHLTTGQLQELYWTYIAKGWREFEYYMSSSEGVSPPQLTDSEVIGNIKAGHEVNYCVFMVGVEGEEDGVMIGLGLSNYDDFGVYLHLPCELLDELVQQYSLIVLLPGETVTATKFLLRGSGGPGVN